MGQLIGVHRAWAYLLQLSVPLQHGCLLLHCVAATLGEAAIVATTTAAATTAATATAAAAAASTLLLLVLGRLAPLQMGG